jgi:hypothetical protein
MAAQGVSFRLAVELLRQDSPALSSIAPASPLVKDAGLVGKSSSRKLPPIAEPSVEDRELAAAVIAHYANTLAGSPEALGFLARRRIDHPEAVESFRLGYANRTLGYRLGSSQTKTGGLLRARLQALGFLRSSGHEHFTGSLVVPVIDELGQVGEVYGRKVAEQRLRSGTPLHLYLPGPHRGVFNLPVFTGTDELIVTESLIDALSFWCAGYRHVTAAYGTGGWTAEHAAAVQVHGIRRVLLAFDADEAGDKGAAAIAQGLMSSGVECFRVELPRGADVNDIVVQAASPREALGRSCARPRGWAPAPRPRRQCTRLRIRSSSAPNPLRRRMSQRQRITLRCSVIRQQRLRRPCTTSRWWCRRRWPHRSHAHLVRSRVRSRTSRWSGLGWGRSCGCGSVTGRGGCAGWSGSPRSRRCA